jgi:hypothetical protein
MEHLPIYIPVIFVLTTLLTVILLYKAGNYSKPLLITLLLWLGLQAAVGLSGFYIVSNWNSPKICAVAYATCSIDSIAIYYKKKQIIYRRLRCKNINTDPYCTGAGRTYLVLVIPS